MQINHHRPPSATDRRFNTVVRWLGDRGVGLAGSQNLTVRGRYSGEPRAVPVNPLHWHGAEYLVSVRGNGQWVRNLRAAGELELSRGRRTRRLSAREVPAADRVPIIAAYLRRWGWEVGRFLPEGLDDPTDPAQLAAHAEQIPVFALVESSTVRRQGVHRGTGPEPVPGV
ncbi:nitroreductase family deazaflavin-dependent oxidoreductase [Naumannella halotolerans]|uniref:Deazaflavin-dependent oxidoreductase (Nitroreductase family) n=1 Tax=Naumannella halotolerans TaxID=993414 RepID=A0A4R7IWP9_9ACTN|nr:nitroreductase family deazaflavin-dependent oxidoreductase [Naumannella halotolerans]TDT29050.1 deazaflavin-dependent oxidoreductase (nitroreductase family) [Naumannella halotolerans]